METGKATDNLIKSTISPISLARKAYIEIHDTGTTPVRCPKCGTAPVVSETPGGEIKAVYCECRYIHNVEINF